MSNENKSFPWDLPKNLEEKPNFLSDDFCIINEKLKSICHSIKRLRSKWEKNEVDKMLKKTIDYSSTFE